MDESSGLSHKIIWLLVIGACLMLALPATLLLGLIYGFLDPQLSGRIVGVWLGTIMAAAGNALPKLVLPLSERRGDAARPLRAERFAGSVFVICGLLVIAIWLLMAQAEAMLYSSVLGVSAFGAAAVHWIWSRVIGRGGER